MKSKTVSGILIILVLSSVLASVVSIPAVESGTGAETADRSSIDTLQFAYDRANNEKGKNSAHVSIDRHRILESELARLKRETGIWESGQDCNQLVARHGTGLAPPTEAEWTRIGETSYIVDKVTLDQMTDTPSSVDHTGSPYFPPIGNQDGEGSCTAWAIGYYTKTFQEAWEHNWDLSEAAWEGGYYGQPTLEYQNRIFSPDFIYHLINSGVDEGSSFYDATALIATVGVSSYEKMPYDAIDHTSWPSEAAWSEASLYRGSSSGLEYLWVDTEEGLTNLKNWIGSDHLAVIGVDAHQYSDLTAADLWTLDNYGGGVINHANTIVGYDDNIGYIEAGEYRNGAFKIANSWGIGGWENVPDGCYWISYRAMEQQIEQCMFFRDMIGYEPELVASFRLAHPKRGECSITVGLGDQDSPLQTKRFVVYGGDHAFCPNNILLDITEFQDAVPTVYNQSYFLKVYDGGSTDTGTISKFAVEYANSQHTPLDTINYQYVYANVTLSPLRTRWATERLVGVDADFREGKIAMATDNKGHLYVAGEDWDAAVNQSAIFVRQSTDDGNTWSTIGIGSDATHNLFHPAIAIDPYSNDVFVAVEREWTPSDHDILVMRHVDGAWRWSPVAIVLGSDDRFPSITSEYAYDEANRQYVSYEYVHTYNDRDLMVAKSADHGATWSIQKLHGGWPDYNVHAQTSISSAEGYVYVAYKWGPDYDSVGDICVDRSTDFGTSWTQVTDLDGLPNGCSRPSLAATHDGSVVMVAFQYDSSAHNVDVYYSISLDRGTSWEKGHALFAASLEDETLPRLAVDGGGSTSNTSNGGIYAVCKSGSYISYRKTRSSDPLSWSSPEVVSERGASQGLAIATQLRGEQFYTCAAWTGGRTRNTYYSWTLSPIHIRADGSVDPPTADISSVDNVTYTFTADICDEIVVERDHIIIDGGDYTLQGPGSGIGIGLTERNNITCTRMRIRSFGIGVYVHRSLHVSLLQNTVASNGCGICLDSSHNNTISGNEITDNSGHGVSIMWLGDNLVSGNNVTSNLVGISLVWTSDVSILGNHITANIREGIDMFRSAANTSGNNIANNGDVGIHIEDGGGSISRNKITGNGIYGLHLQGFDQGSIVDNRIADHDVGIGLNWTLDPENGFVYCQSNTIANNTITAHQQYALQLVNSSSNLIYHNTFGDNVDQISNANSLNTWDDGYPRGGNYWSDFAVTYPSVVDDYHGEPQDVLGSDGVWDGPYEIDVDNHDRYPLTEPWDPPKIAGDIDRDGDVDIYDLSLAGKSYGCTCSHLGYNRQADINCDGRVDIRDIAIIGKHWGKVAP